MSKAKERDIADKVAHDEILRTGAAFLAAIKNAEERGLSVGVHKLGMGAVMGFEIHTRREFAREMRPVGKVTLKK